MFEILRMRMYETLIIILSIFFLFYSLLFLIFLINTFFISVMTRSNLRKFLKEQTVTEEKIFVYMTKQKEIFLPRLLFLKVSSIIFFLYFCMRILTASIKFLETWLSVGEPSQTFLIPPMYEQMLSSFKFIIASLMTVVFYFIFSWIFQKRMLTLEKLKKKL